MRKWTGMLFAALMLAQLTACGQGNNAISTSTATTESTTTAESTTDTTTDTSADTETESQETGESAEAGSSNEEVSDDEALNTIHQEIKDAYGETYIPSMLYDEQTLTQMFNVDAEWCESYIAEGPMISAHVDTFIGIKAKPDMADSVEKALTEYQDMLIENSIQYPMNQLKVEASQVVRQDDYVFFVMLGQIPEDIEEESAGLEAAKESNQIAVDIIDAYFE